jgi:prepilin signal peptidase PulO-like enzyme (type II secretory pathway)
MAPMEWIVAAGAGAIAALVMWLATGVQHHLYSNPAHRVLQTRRQDLVRRIGISAAGALVAVIALRPDHYDVLPALATVVFALALLVLASTDIERRLLPNRLTYPAILAAVAVCWIWPDRTALDIAIGAGVLLGVGVVFFILGVVLSLLLRIRTTAFGIGDVKLMLLIALLLGWPAALSALFIGVIAAGVPAVVMIMAGRARGVFSYGPFLVLGALIPMLWPSAFV